MSILTQLKAEMKKELKIYFTDLKNVTRPNQTWRVGDTIRFDVRLKNTGPIEIVDIRGQVTNGYCVTFTSQTFELASLDPNGDAHTVINNLEAEITRDMFPSPPFRPGMDLIAFVNLRANANLAKVRFTDGEVFRAEVKQG